jgi:hypothetical protein
MSWPSPSGRVATRLTLPSSSMRPTLFLQAAGRVDEHDVGAVGLAPLHRGIGHRGGIGALFLPDGFDPDALAPGGQLFGGSGAEGVRGAEQDGLVLGYEHTRDLAHRRRLPGAVDADDEDDGGVVSGSGGGQRPVHGRIDEGDELFSQQPAHLFGISGAEHLDAFAQPIDEFGGRIDSDIGEDQGVLDLLPRRFVEVVTRQEVEQSPPEAGVRLREPLTQAHQPAGRLRGHFGAASLGLLLLDRLGDLIDAELTGDIGIDAVLVAQALLLRVDAQADAQRNDENEYDGRDDEQDDRLIHCSSVLL